MEMQHWNRAAWVALTFHLNRPAVSTPQVTSATKFTVWSVCPHNTRAPDTLFQEMIASQPEQRGANTFGKPPTSHKPSSPIIKTATSHQIQGFEITAVMQQY
jgi:hypothetical protein